MSTEAIIPAPGIDVTKVTSPPKVAFSSEEEERQARERLAIIQPLLDYERCAPHEPQMGLDFDLGRNASEICDAIAAQRQLSPRTVRRWLHQFREGGLLALGGRTRADKGKSRFFESYREAAILAAYVHLEQRQSAVCAYEAIVRDRENLGIPPEKLPSYHTVRRWLQSIPPIYVTLARQGRRAYRENMAPYISRDHDSAASNEIWVSDHMIHDVEVQNDCFAEAPIGTPIRLRFTALLDWHSRYLVGWSWAWEGSSRSIATALRNAVMRHGPAASLYCDNGKDYLKVAKGAVPAYLRSEMEPTDWWQQELVRIEELGVLARLGMAVTHCIVRHPQSKHVERFFRTLHERLDKKFPTYTGGSPATRPDFTADAMAQHRKLLRIGRPEQSLHPRASAFMAMSTAWIEEYQERKHRGQAMRGRSPQQVFEEDRRADSRPVPQAQDLALLLMDRDRRWVRECSVTLNKRRYIGADEIGRTVMHELNECEVLIAYDPLDLDAAAILDLNGRLLTMAKAENLLPQSSDANDAIAESMAERRRLEKQTAQTIMAIGDAARANGAITEVEHLARRAQVLQMAVGDHITQRRMHVRPDDRAVAPLSPDDAARVLLEEE
jgi:DNA-binding transcriptional ArsR family regulator